MTHRWMFPALVIVALHLVLSAVFHVLSISPTTPLYLTSFWGLLIAWLVMMVVVGWPVYGRLKQVQPAVRALRQRYGGWSGLVSPKYWQEHWKLEAPRAPRWLHGMTWAAQVYALIMALLGAILVIVTALRLADVQRIVGGTSVHLLLPTAVMLALDLYLFTLLYSQWKESTAAVTGNQ